MHSVGKTYCNTYVVLANRKPIQASPVHTPVTSSRSPRVHVFPEPGKLARATGSRSRPSMNRQVPLTAEPNLADFFWHFLEQLVKWFSSGGERSSLQYLVSVQTCLILSVIGCCVSFGTRNLRFPTFRSGINWLTDDDGLASCWPIFGGRVGLMWSNHVP